MAVYNPFSIFFGLFVGLIEPRRIFVASIIDFFLPNPWFYFSQALPTAISDFKVCLAFNPYHDP